MNRQTYVNNQNEKNMKQKLIAIALLFSLSANVNLAAPKHRHHQKTEVVQKKDTTAQDEVVAYSDTTSIAEEEDDAVTTTTTITHSNDPWEFDDPLSWLGALTGSLGGILIVCLILLILLVIALSPFIILALILRLIIRRHNDRITLAEKAMETGQPIPEALKPIDRQTDAYLWSRGIRNVAIGAGMFIMFWIWKSTMLSGLGALVLCYGIGQMVIARTTANKNRDKNNDIDPLL